MNHVFQPATVEKSSQAPIQTIAETKENMNRLSIFPNTQQHIANGIYNDDADHNQYFRDLFNQYVLYLWMLGVIVSLAANLIGYVRFSTHIKRTNMEATDKEKNILASLMNGSSRHVRLVRNRFVSTPMLIGILRPYIIIPDYNFSERQLKNILLHEMVHLRRHDLAIKWLTMIVTSIHWFNPLMYFIKKEMNLACELACDEVVIKDLDADEKQAYGDTLISIAGENKYPAGALQATMCEEKKNLRERLVAIMNYRKKSKFIVLNSSALFIAIIFVATALGASVGTAEADNKVDHIIQTDAYQLSVPEDWSTERLPGFSLSFKKDGTEIGGLDPIAYYPDQPISQLRPNHTEVVASKKLEGYFTEVILEKLKQTPPAASGDTTVTETIHIYFIIKDKKMAYDLYFKTPDIDEKTALGIAKSFKLKSDSIKP